MLEKANKNKVLYVNNYIWYLIFHLMGDVIFIIYTKYKNFKQVEKKEKYKNELNTVIKELKRLDSQLSNFINNRNMYNIKKKEY
ncbi:hypothetical protein FDC22_15050 [Clostridium botulinum]|nr:hypothetical protein [Clostridium botulinum]EPS54329.1 hypothetical protein CLQ_13618 [Clostridium botulinum Af84]APR02769.1 hypothetical protein RSJ2_3876 [Clostridium botulinum]AUN19736.1 hypothetical protein B2M06_19470 [Clostridium botulinum]NFD75069.1 hypothetical protein [Clostridium botulinum]NFD82224.1 hypothetical protein [Clostridium botulinum]